MLELIRCLDVHGSVFSDRAADIARELIDGALMGESRPGKVQLLARARPSPAAFRAGSLRCEPAACARAPAERLVVEASASSSCDPWLVEPVVRGVTLSPPPACPPPRAPRPACPADADMLDVRPETAALHAAMAAVEVAGVEASSLQQLVLESGVEIVENSAVLSMMRKAADRGSDSPRSGAPTPARACAVSDSPTLSRPSSAISAEYARADTPLSPAASITVASHASLSRARSFHGAASAHEGGSSARRGASSSSSSSSSSGTSGGCFH